LAHRIEFDPAALKDLKKLDRAVQQRLVVFLRTRLSGLDDPRSLGEPLAGARLGTYWKYRVGDWRITSLTAVEGFRQRYGFDFDGTLAAVANLSYDRDYLQVSQELYGRVKWQGGDALNLGCYL
jgi:mRNA interferase RelE/StbE